MAAPSPSSLSQVCRKIADFVRAEVNRESIDTTNHDGHEHNVEQVTLGSPAVHDVKDMDATTQTHKLNLFFYRFEPFEFNADVLPGETWLLRTHCLITPFSGSEDYISAGENDLRLLGEVMRVFHETPVQYIAIDDHGEMVDFHIQAVFEPLSTESINQIWSTQGDIAYRPSVSYEISLAPVLPRTKSIEAPLVAATGLQASGNMDRARAKLAGTDYSDIVQTPVVNKVAVNTTLEDWAPVICFVYASKCIQTMSFDLSDSDSGVENFEPMMWVAGEIGAKVSFYWNVWTSEAGWKTIGPADVIPDNKIQSTMIDPDAIDSSLLMSLSKPMDGSVEVLGRPGQVALYAERTYQRIPEEPARTVRSNLLLLTLYES